MAAPRRRVLILSTTRDRGTLSAARSLRRAGWAVGVGTPVPGGGMVGASNAVERSHLVPRPRGDGADFVDGVRRAVVAGSYELVVGSGDEWMAALSRYRDHVPAPVPHPPWPVVTEALDKLRLARRAVPAGLTAPRTEPATESGLAAWQGPVVVKCRTHWSPGQTRPHRIEAKRFPDAAAAREQVLRMRHLGAEPVLQAPVDGHLSALVGLFRNGRLDGRVQQESARLWPTPNGVSTRAVTVPVDEDLAGRAERLLAALGWSGLVELQFLTGSDGVRHLVDLNGRFYGSMALADAARPGLADAWARDALGEDVPALPDGTPGVRYTWAAGDLRRAWTERRDGLLRDVTDTVRWASRARHSVWHVGDLGPIWHLMTSRVRPEPPPAGSGPIEVAGPTPQQILETAAEEEVHLRHTAATASRTMSRSGARSTQSPAA